MNAKKLYTIGYGNRNLNQFISLIVDKQIDMLVDVRSKPFSRFRPAYNKNSLSKALVEVGITYVFKGDQLGGIIPEGTSYDKLREEEYYQAGLDYLYDELKAGKHIVIMCCELDPLACHRSILIGEDLSHRNIEVLHFGKQGELIKHTKRLM